MELVKVIIFLSAFYSIVDAIDSDSIVIDSYEIEDTVSKKVYNSDSASIGLEVIKKGDSTLLTIESIVENGIVDTSYNKVDTHYTAQKKVDKGENVDTIKVANSIFQNTEDSLKVKYPYYYKNSPQVKIATAIGTSVAIGGIISFILVKQLKKSLPKNSDIPEPPLPPAY